MNNPGIKLNEITDCFIFGRLDSKTTDNICKEIANCRNIAEFQAAGVGSNANSWVQDDIRSANLAWLDDAPNTSHILGKLVLDANDFKFKLEGLVDTKPSIQYTVYKSFRDHYDWHQDYYDDEPVDENLIRLISISVCLSHDDMYEGAEFCIKDGCNYNVRQFKMKYGEFIIFPSRIQHRVNALRSGERISLVNWFGNPTKKALKRLKKRKKRHRGLKSN
tara:strand:- start:454 stop:1113 length:660 start_codon:yes stop_codon:yes gene_type:complete